ncbi:MAG: OmpH family outer membrane protein [Bacteroidales bacterium]|nr:OmpH family outer membrane protein [Bacteroidales bacterium]
MKKTGIILAIFLLSAGTAFAQKYAFVDTDYILNNIPAYKAAEEELDQQSTVYEAEITTLYEAIDQMHDKYQSEELLLSREESVARKNEIVKKQTEARELQNEYFGQEGLLFNKREELIKPIQDEVYNAVKEIANESGYAVIFDTSSGPSMLYTNPRYDVSDEVLRRLGYKN